MQQPQHIETKRNSESVGERKWEREREKEKVGEKEGARIGERERERKRESESGRDVYAYGERSHISHTHVLARAVSFPPIDLS